MTTRSNYLAPFLDRSRWLIASLVAGLICLVAPYCHAGEVMTVSTLYTVPINPLNGVHPLWTPVQHYHGYTFVVVPDVKLRPMVTQIDSAGKVTTVPLDPNPDYTASTDGHNRFTLGIDKDGYIHIIGDMHGYAPWASTYVERYQYQNMMYWRSNKALDVTGGFTFTGGIAQATAFPGVEWGGDSRFFNDRNGELYYSSRVRAFFGGNLSGSEPFIAYGVYRYYTETGRWRAMGGSAESAAASSGATQFNTVLYWEHTNSFEALQTAPRFDSHNRLHFAVAGNTAGTQGQALLYAYSDDDGLTWKKASGAPIPGLPIRGKDGEPNQGDLVLRSTKVAQQSPLFIDKNGKLAINGDGTWRTWNGTAWVPFTGGMGILAPDGMMTLEGGSVLRRTPAIGEPDVAYETGFGQVFSMSELALENTGEVYAVGLPPGTNFVGATKMSVFKATFAPPVDAATDGKTVPVAPKLFYAQADDARTWLSWTPAQRATSYVVKRAPKGGAYAVIAKDVTQIAEFTDTTCRNGVAYTYQVAGVNAAGEGPASDAMAVTPHPHKPQAPIIQTAVGHNARITLNWLPLWPESATYTIKRSLVKDGPFVVVASGVTGLSYTDTGLTNDTPYFYVMTASDTARHQSADSAVISGSPFRWMRILHYKSVGKDDTGTASASAENPPNEVASRAFDGGLASKWLMSGGAGWLQYTFAPGETWAVTRYSMISGQDGPERDPADWTFEGSVDGKTWVVLDTQSKQAFANRNGTNTYTFENKTAYHAYRLNITKNRDGNNGLIQLAELQFWVDDKVLPAPAKP